MSAANRARVPDVARIEAQLAELWRGTAGDGDPVTHACTLNLVVVCSDGMEDLQAATNLVARVAETEPGRALVVSFPEDNRQDGDAEGGSVDGMQVYVSAHCHRGADGTQICSEQITLEARGAGRELIPATVLQLLVGQLPVYTLWRRQEFGDDPLPRALLDMSDRFIANSGNRHDPLRAIRGLQRFAASVSGEGRTADISWERVECWREALASFFDAPTLRPSMEQITGLAIEASGPAGDGHVTAAGAYLAGWLASRLGWKRDQVRISFAAATDLPPREVASVRIETSIDGAPAALVARRIDPTSDVVLLSAETEKSCPLPWKIKLPARDDAALLCGLLQRSRKDPIFDAALNATCKGDTF